MSHTRSNQAAKRGRRVRGKRRTVSLESLGVGGGEEKGEAAGEQDEESGRRRRHCPTAVGEGARRKWAESAPPTSISAAAADSGGHAGGGEEGFMAGDRERTKDEIGTDAVVLVGPSLQHSKGTAVI